ncbi:Multidrug efflux pump subunit AcrB [Pseudidiomarina planktonica]|uniref:Multidrug efflux pump subunit AcrB n=1 Tax=Pseudidiomarina planktonica TaxID=1323738 RepID=A0A1Y6EUH7_9GAMM|nr:efflux RND transporter permease subunit [Pseudidiomarina planktonica]RUO65166.1 AcrB/AcrD/AcrF family protein [Pseudidiomarina planktonica]SMQ66207.1 Multidrug efflux pump subunit AcrB [Pseudidiomarina planktonica]
MSIASLAVKRPVTIAMITLAVLLFGMVSLSRLPVTLLPDLSYPTLTIRTDYLGAAPAEVEQLVSKPIEESIGTVKGVRRVESISRAGQSDVMLEFAWGSNMDMASLDVREKLDLVELPLDIENPLILRFNPALDPIFRLALKTADNNVSTANLKRLRTYAEEDLKRQLESIDGVASVRLGGGLEDEVQILVNEQRSTQLQIPMSLIIERLRAENINLSGGRIETERHEYLVRTLNQFETLDDIRAIYIATRNDSHIQLSDIAEIRDGYKDRDAITRVGGAEAVELSLYKEGDANTVAVAKAIRSSLQQLQQANLIPAEYTLAQIYDQSVFIGAAISEVRDAAIFGGLLAMVIIYLFLQRVWPTVIISLAIPVSIIATFNLLYSNNISLNMMSLGGIALAVGMLVDNAIVVLENIARHQQDKSADKAAEQGTSEVAGAITASTLTTMAVFFPLVFVEGIAGQLFSDQALTVTFALLASLFVALTLIPMLAARQSKTVDSIANDPLMQPQPPRDLPWWRVALAFPVTLIVRYIPFAITAVIQLIWRVLSRGFLLLTKPLLAAFNAFYLIVESAYTRLLQVCLRRAPLTLASILLVAVACYSLLPRLPVALLPAMAQGEFYVEVELAPGAAIHETDATLQTLSAALANETAIERFYSVAGTGSLLNASPAQGGDYWGRLNVVMKSSASPATEAQVMDRLRETAARLPGVMVKFGRPELFNFTSPLVIELTGYNLPLLQQSAQQVADALAATSELTDIRVNMTNGQPEIAVQFDHARLAKLGLTAADVSELLAAKIGGRVATQYSLDDRKIDVLVRSQIQDRDSVSDLRQLVINPGSERELPLHAVATITQITGPSEITRIDQERTALVEANIVVGDLAQAVAAAQAVLDNQQLPLGVTAVVSGQNEEMEQSFRSLQFALLLAVFLVYLVMASQFESLLHPFFILFTVPLAGAGSVLGLAITGTSLSIIVFIGLIMLAGIVVNNAIVLVDRMNQLRAEGVERITAVATAAQQRLRPILMTMMTTVLGLLPLALGLGEGAEIRAPMAISVIFGLFFSTALTLLFIPALYTLFDRKSYGVQS